MAKKGKTKRPAVRSKRKPKNQTEARAWLLAIAEHIGETSLVEQCRVPADLFRTVTSRVPWSTQAPAADEDAGRECHACAGSVGGGVSPSAGRVEGAPVA